MTAASGASKGIGAQIAKHLAAPGEESMSKLAGKGRLDHRGAAFRFRRVAMTAIAFPPALAISSTTLSAPAFDEL
jgi:hypothetical protein